MFLNFIANLFPEKNYPEQAKASSKLSVKTEKLPAISNFSRGERQVLHVWIKSNGN